MFLEEEKKELSMPEGVVFSPDVTTHIRIGRILSVSLNSKDAVVQLVDGERDEDNEFLEPPESIPVIVGSDDPETTYTPSASVYGRYDLVAVLVMPDGLKSVVSPMDRHAHSNRENYALIKEWALYDVLNGLLVDINIDGGNSYLEFISLTSLQVTRISGDPEKRNVLKRLLEYYKVFGQNTISYTFVWFPGWPRELTGGGCACNPQIRYNDKVYAGRGVNGFNYAEWDLLAYQGVLDAKMVAFHDTLEDLKWASCHPGADITRDIYFESFCTIWFEDDPDYVLLIGSFPAWETAPYLRFVEVAVSSLSGRKKLDPDETDSDAIVFSWQEWPKNARIIHTIHRSYINWTAHEASVELGERLYRALSVYINTPVNGSCTFGFIDGYGFDQGGVILTPCKLRQCEGTIVRGTLNESIPTPANGSRHNYAINHNDPSSSGVVDNWYSIHFDYFDDNAGTGYEKQTNNDPEKVYTVLTNGTDSLTKTIDFDYNCTGHYDQSAGGGGGGMTSWSDGADGSMDGVVSVLNQFWQKVYHNGAFLYTDDFVFDMTIGEVVADFTHHFIHFSDIETGLFVLERTTGHFEGVFGAGYDTLADTSYTKKELVVFYGGLEYIIWVAVRDETTFSTIYNFYPWMEDAGYPKCPTEAPYDTQTDYSCVFFLTPVLWNYIEPVDGYQASAGQYPCPRDDACTLNWVSMHDDNDGGTFPSDYLQVSVDHDSDSWVVRAPCWLDDVPADVTVTYPSTEDTVIRLNGAVPTFNKPAPTKDIIL